MITRVTTIKLDERSANVANLHAAMRALGVAVDPPEVNEQRAGESTAKVVRDFQQRMNIKPQPGYLVDEATAEAMNRLLMDRGVGPTDPSREYQVRGLVNDPDGTASRGYTVTAFDQDLRLRQELGHATTDANGEYVVFYGSQQFQQADLGGADLVLVVTGANGEVLATTEVLFNAPPVATINITLTKLGSEAEYDRVSRLVTRLVENQQIAIDALDENDKHQD